MNFCRINALIYLNACVFFSRAVTDIELFKLSFGHDQVSQHFKDTKSFTTAKNHAEAMTRRMKTHAQHLTCGSYLQASSFRESLEQKFGKENVQPFHISKSSLGGKSCFLLMPSDHISIESIKDFSSQEIFLSPMPLMLKVSSQLNVILQQLGEVTDNSNWSELNLEVIFGLGNLDNKIDVKKYVHNILSDLSMNYFSSISELKTSSLQDDNIWEKISQNILQQELTHEDISSTCNINLLSFIYGNSYIYINNLDIFDNTPHPYICFGGLIAAFVTHSKTFSITITPSPHLTNDFVAQFVQSGSGSASSTSGRVYHAVGLTGSTVYVGVADTGADEYSCYLRNTAGSVTVTRTEYNSPFPTYDTSRTKIIQYVNYYDSTEAQAEGHGTHVCGTIAGKRSNFGDAAYYDGVAPEAKIAFFDIGVTGSGDISVPDVYTYVLTDTFAAGARIHSNSWGVSYYTYNAYALQFDRFSVDYPESLSIVAAGNDGANGAGSVTAPGLSKNVLTVGAGGTGSGTGIDTVYSTSGLGPTFDLRFGIDVIAQGASVYSASSAGSSEYTCTGVSLSGTSMATAAVAGAAAMVRQYFTDVTFWAVNCRVTYAYCGAFTPSGALMKAVIIHAGNNMGGAYAYPGDAQGFGRVVLTNVLVYTGITSTDMDLFVEEIVLQEYSGHTYTIMVTDPTINVKVTIVWMDPINSISASKQLLNDVDLVVTTPSSVMHYGNGVTGGDEYNNVEQVLIESPAAGNYSVVISALSFGSGTEQKVAVVITSKGQVTPSNSPTAIPTRAPSRTPTRDPTRVPSRTPTEVPTRSPSVNPTSLPTRNPSRSPTVKPSESPTFSPTRRPTESPTFAPLAPTKKPSSSPSRRPTEVPTPLPSSLPTFRPSSLPSCNPTSLPSLVPSESPTSLPSLIPSISYPPSSLPSSCPTAIPSSIPTAIPSITPTSSPSRRPTSEPSSSPTRVPISSPSRRPTLTPTSSPTSRPTEIPTAGTPSEIPSSKPSRSPSSTPSSRPTLLPTIGIVTFSPTRAPSKKPTAKPSSHAPSETPSIAPTDTFTPSTSIPTSKPSSSPSSKPTKQPLCPTSLPTRNPQNAPTIKPTTEIPTSTPSEVPTSRPTKVPSSKPTRIPILDPTSRPTKEPTEVPTRVPSSVPSSSPSKTPSSSPSSRPTGAPLSSRPSFTPSSAPSSTPHEAPTVKPTTATPTTSPSIPTCKPSLLPSGVPSIAPSKHPSISPTSYPIAIPSVRPSVRPSAPSNAPSRRPTYTPSINPTRLPSYQPSRIPSTEPTTSSPSSPSSLPSCRPTRTPSYPPTRVPTSSPSVRPSVPSSCPSSAPSRIPTSTPTVKPTVMPSARPTRSPTSAPSRTPTRLPTRS